MQCSVQILLLGTLAVVMVTSAPLSNQEKLVSVDQVGEAVDRAKRADEEIVFGNQQNKARVVAKKSDLSNILSPSLPQGERDQGSEVIVHKEMPVSEDLAARAEAAVGSASENNEKMKEAVEAAIQSVAEAVKSEAESSDQEAANKVDADEKGTKQSVEEELEENEQGTGEVSDLPEEKVQAEDEDEDLKDLQRAADGNIVAEGGSVTGGSDNEETSPENKEDVMKFLQESSAQDDSDNELDRDRERSYYENRMHNYLMSLTNRHGFHSIRPFITRYRRSFRSPRKSHTSKNNKRARRIKRDLLDDSYYGPYDLHVAPYAPEDANDALISSPDQYAPLSDEEAEYLYKELVNYLANSYEPEQEEPVVEETPLDSYLNGYEDVRDEPYSPYGIYNEDNLPLVRGAYDERYPYAPVDFDSYQNYAKRGMIDYYPLEEEKRYFFPFSKEPETHWGAFVPEKRDNGEAIQRLQRLAMALSDNPGPYYREMLEEYRRK